MGNRILQEERDVVVAFITDVLSSRESCLEVLLDLVGLSSQRLCVVDRVTNVGIVKEDVLSHGPKFDTNTCLSVSVKVDTRVMKQKHEQYCLGA